MEYRDHLRKHNAWGVVGSSCGSRTGKVRFASGQTCCGTLLPGCVIIRVERLFLLCMWVVECQKTRKRLCDSYSHGQKAVEVTQGAVMFQAGHRNVSWPCSSTRTADDPENEHILNTFLLFPRVYFKAVSKLQTPVPMCDRPDESKQPTAKFILNSVVRGEVSRSPPPPVGNLVPDFEAPPTSSGQVTTTVEHEGASRHPKKGKRK